MTSQCESMVYDKMIISVKRTYVVTELVLRRRRRVREEGTEKISLPFLASNRRTRSPLNFAHLFISLFFSSQPRLPDYLSLFSHKTIRNNGLAEQELTTRDQHSMCYTH